MDFGLALSRIRYEALVPLVQKAEAAGFESAWVAEHLIWPATLSARTYPYSENGLPPVPTDVPTLDAWVLLAWLAGQTRRIKLGTGIYILPLRHPVITARTVMTLDYLSGGRAILGAGAGWLPDEYAIVGADFPGRGRRMDEYIAAIRTLWRDPTPEFHGRFVDFDPVKFEPKPVQRPGVPILIGGESEVALRRAARLGDGWYSMFHNVASGREQIARINRYRAEYGRAEEPFSFTVLTWHLPTLDAVAQYAEGGATRLVVNFSRTREAAEGIERFAEAVIARA